MEQSRGRKVAVGVVLTLATLIWVIATLGVWAHRQTLDEDNWVDTSTALLENDEIRSALGLYLVDQVYDSDQVATSIAGALPDRFDPLAKPAAAGLRQVADRNAPRILGSKAALTAWEKANRAAIVQFKRFVDGDLAPGGKVSLNLQDLMTQIADKTGLPQGAADKLPPSVAELTILESDQLDNARKAVNAFEAAAIALVVIGIFLWLLAFFISHNRRRTVITIGGCIMLAGLLVLVARRLGGNLVVNSLGDAPNAHDAAGEAWNIATSLLVDAAVGSIFFGVLLITGALLGGPARWAVAARRRAEPFMRENAGWVRAALGVLILLLVWWGPVPWTQKPLQIVIFTVLAYLWLEWIRRQTLEEFATDAPLVPPTGPELKPAA
jgi:hypothetical protein